MCCTGRDKTVSCTELWEKPALGRLEAVRSETCHKDGRWIGVAPDHAWYRDLVSAMLSLGSCYRKGSLEFMDISVGWTTEESGFDNRRGHVFIISTVCRPALGPTLP